MADSKIDWSQLADSIIADYKESGDITVLQKFTHFLVSYKQPEAVIKIIKNHEIFESIVFEVDNADDIDAELLTNLWNLENREICLLYLQNVKIMEASGCYDFMNKTHKMFTERWTDALELAYKKFCNNHGDSDEADKRFAGYI